jgi:hypothetical protein
MQLNVKFKSKIFLSTPNGLTKQNPPLALPTPSHIPLAWHSGTEVVTSVGVHTRAADNFFNVIEY